ncbi:unnamed protein product [Acanthoscelides obtectus]|nr:unnamed protein product [Acanthoscelides obtectus]CAK1628833.1 hypothetical protein AOBTE_LOCUS5421 [Acanthoscelides obtectus]
MSALLAAALQNRPKNTETEIQVQEDGTKITLTRPAVVQNARIVKPVQLQLPTNVVRAPQPNLSSTTLEQLREFDMVYKQIKERSSNTTPTEITSEQTQEVTPQRISVTYVNQLPKYTQLSPVVVVSSYSHLQQAATSPALSVTSQSSLSPSTTPTSTPSSAAKITTKTSKALIVGKTFKNHTNNTTAKTPPISKPQQKPQEDEHTTQRIFDILAEYAEQLRNSPDLNNKPAPRRRSNPPTNPNQNSKRKKSSSTIKKSTTTSNVDIDTDDMTVGSEDSSGGGIVQLSVTDDEQSQSQAATTSVVETEATTATCPRQVILTEGSSVSSQPRNVIIADSTVGEALKMSNTAVIVPGSYIMPVSMVKGGQQIAVMSGGSKILATVPARSGQNMLLFQSFTNQNRKGAISAVKYSSIQSVSGISSQSIAGVSAQPPVILPSNSVATAVAIGQQLSLKKIGQEREGEVLLTISKKDDAQPDSVTSVSSDSEDVKIPEQTSVKVDHPVEKIIHTYQKPISTNKSVIATSSQKVDQGSCPQPTVINTAKVSTTLNGPMLSHITTNRFRKITDNERIVNRGSEVKEESTHNGAKVTNPEPKTYRSSAIYSKVKKVTIESQKPESDAQKQAMLERELRLQKSLSEECEDLGVDEPSTSDLFPEADLLFDSNHSPSFDQNSQEGVKKTPHGTEKEEGTKSSINLFSDDDNSSSLKSDLFEYVEYHAVENALDHQAKQLMNGNNPETETSSCEDNTLLPKCSNMSEVTLNSPISPEVYAESSVNKYKFKYTNRKKSEKIKQSDSRGETITNSEEAVSGADSCKLSSEEEHYKVVHVAITKSDITKEESRCELHVCEEFVDSPSGRGARRSVRKLCSCCNGSQDGHLGAKKRPNSSSRPQTPATPHKKPFLKKDSASFLFSVCSSSTIESLD